MLKLNIENYKIYLSIRLLANKNVCISFKNYERLIKKTYQKHTFLHYTNIKVICYNTLVINIKMDYYH